MARAAFATPVRVVLGDCHDVFAHDLRGHLANDRRLDVVGCASDGEELVALVRDQRPDLVLIDSDLPGIDSAEATRQIHDADASVRVLIMASPGAQLDSSAAKEAGAAGFLRKDASAARVVAAIPAVSDVVSALAELTPL